MTTLHSTYHHPSQGMHICSWNCHGTCKHWLVRLTSSLSLNRGYGRLSSTHSTVLPGVLCTWLFRSLRTPTFLRLWGHSHSVEVLSFSHSYGLGLLCRCASAVDHVLSSSQVSSYLLTSDYPVELESVILALQSDGPVRVTGDFNAHLGCMGDLRGVGSMNVYGQLLFDLMGCTNLFVASLCQISHVLPTLTLVLVTTVFLIAMLLICSRGVQHWTTTP